MASTQRVGSRRGEQRPPSLQRRAPVPDIARGVMLALIALANVMIYLYDRPYGVRQHIVEEGLLDRVVTAALVMFVDGRAYPLFAALFGYGIVRIAARAREKRFSERQVTSMIRRRFLWLIGFGFVHALLAFSGDVLGWYGLLGVVLASRTRASDRALLGFAAGWLVIASAVQGLLYADAEVSDQRTFLWSFAIENPLEAGAWRVLEWLMTPVGLLSVVSAVLVGMWAGRRRILERPADHRRLLRRVVAVGVPAGVLGGVGMALVTAHAWTPPVPVIMLLSWLHILTGVLCGLGYAALIALLTERSPDATSLRPSAVVFALRATGERSLSCYLAQSIVFVALLTPSALGWGASLGTAAAAALALATWLVTVLVATLLARNGIPGPGEAALRRLSRAPWTSPDTIR